MLTPFAAAARAVGLDPYRMVRRAGLPVGALDDPNQHISARRFEFLLEDSARVIDARDFGLMVARRYALPMAGPIGLLIRQQPNVAAVLESAPRYLGHQVDSIEVACRTTREGRFVGLHVRLPVEEISVQFVELMVGCTLRIFQGLLGDAWRPLRVTFTHESPVDLSAYRAFFGDVRFGEPENGLLLTAQDLAQPIAGADPGMAQEIARYIERSGPPLVSQTFAQRVSVQIRRLLPAGRCDVGEVAALLGVDRRTVHRRLAMEGGRFSDLVDAARREIARSELTRGGVALAEVAAKLGFSSPSTFSRWFRQTYGMQPSQFRRLGGRGFTGGK